MQSEAVKQVLMINQVRGSGSCPRKVAILDPISPFSGQLSLSPGPWFGQNCCRVALAPRPMEWCLRQGTVLGKLGLG